MYHTSLRTDLVQPLDDGTYRVNGSGWFWTTHRADGSLVSHNPKMDMKRSSVRTFAQQAGEAVRRFVAQRDQETQAN